MSYYYQKKILNSPSSAQNPRSRTILCNHILRFAAFVDFAAQAKLARFESAGASALHTLRLDVYPGDATGTQKVGV